MRAADDFAAIRARMDQLQGEREPAPAPPKRDDTNWRVQRVSIEKIARVAQEKTWELLRRA